MRLIHKVNLDRDADVTVLRVGYDVNGGEYRNVLLIQLDDAIRDVEFIQKDCIDLFRSCDSERT